MMREESNINNKLTLPSRRNRRNPDDLYGCRERPTLLPVQKRAGRRLNQCQHRRRLMDTRCESFRSFDQLKIVSSPALTDGWGMGELAN
jgi:hypothetical protein